MIARRSKRNPVIEFARFLFAIMIMFWHTRGYHGGGSPSFCGKAGYIAVEYFFLVSGYLVAAKAQSQRSAPFTAMDVIGFLKGKLKGVLPVYIIALTCAIVKTAVLDHLSLIKILYKVLLSIWDSMFLRMSGVAILQFIGGGWFVSAMLIGGVIVYTLQRRFQEWYSLVIGPLLSMFLFGYLYHEYNCTLNVTTNGFKLFYPGLIRAVAEMSLGCVLFEISRRLKMIRFTRFSSACFSLIGFCCIVIVFAGATIELYRFDYIMVLLLALSVMIMFSEQTLYFRKPREALDQVFSFLGRLSLPMYLNHMWIKDVVVALSKGMPRTKGMAIYIISVIIFSIFCLFLINYLSKIFTKYRNKIKKVFICEESAI